MTRDHRPPRWRVKLVRETPAPSFPAASLRTSRDVWQAFRFLAERDREEFWIAALDGKNHLIGTHCVSVGTLTASLVHPREVAKVLVLTSAAAFLCVHVHPSGDPTPSAEDSAITERLRQCSELLGIKLLDHVIIGADRYFSFSDEGQLEGGSGPATPC